MKILFVSLNDHVPWGGSEELWKQAAIQLNTNHEVKVLVKKWEDEPEQIAELKINGIGVFYKPSKEQVKNENRFYLRLKNKLLQNMNVNNERHDFNGVEQIESFHMVVLSIGNHADGKLPSYASYLSAKKIDYVIIVQLATDLSVISDEFSCQLKNAYENAKAVYFLAEENIWKTEMMLGCSLKNRKLINNPFDINQQYLEYEKNNEKINVACVASMICFHKAQDLLITVLGQEKWKKRNICLNLYGKGINKEQLQRLISLYGLQNQVNIMGYEPDKVTIWEKNLACIMPSRMEGQSLAMLEALSFGRLVIATAVGDASRLIADEETGFLIEAPTFALIDAALEKAWARRNEWVEIGRKARERLLRLISTDPINDFSNSIEAIL